MKSKLIQLSLIVAAALVLSGCSGKIHDMPRQLLLFHDSVSAEPRLSMSFSFAARNVSGNRVQTVAAFPYQQATLADWVSH